MPAATLSVEVVYAEPGRQVLKQLDVAPGTKAAEAIRIADIMREFPDADIAEPVIAIWGRRADGNVELRDGDRVEILRPLLIDPRDARRALAQSGQVMGSAKDPL